MARGRNTGRNYHRPQTSLQVKEFYKQRFKMPGTQKPLLQMKMPHGKRLPENLCKVHPVRHCRNGPQTHSASHARWSPKILEIRFRSAGTLPLLSRTERHCRDRRLFERDERYGHIARIPPLQRGQKIKSSRTGTAVPGAFGLRMYGLEPDSARLEPIRVTS